MEEKILTLHPQGKKGTNILKRRYDILANFILDTLKEHGTLTFSELGDIAVETLEGKLDGSIMWYYTTVKLDLEARGLIERIPKTSPHQLQLNIDKMKKK